MVQTQYESCGAGTLLWSGFLEGLGQHLVGQLVILGHQMRWVLLQGWVCDVAAADCASKGWCCFPKAGAPRVSGCTRQVSPQSWDSREEGFFFWWSNKPVMQQASSGSEAVLIVQSLLGTKRFGVLHAGRQTSGPGCFCSWESGQEAFVWLSTEAGSKWCSSPFFSWGRQGWN